MYYLVIFRNKMRSPAERVYIHERSIIAIYKTSDGQNYSLIAKSDGVQLPVRTETFFELINALHSISTDTDVNYEYRHFIGDGNIVIELNSCVQVGQSYHSHPYRLVIQSNGDYRYTQSFCQSCMSIIQEVGHDAVVNAIWNSTPMLVPSVPIEIRKKFAVIEE